MTRQTVTRRNGTRHERMRPDRRAEADQLEWATTTRLGQLTSWCEGKWHDDGWWWKTYAGLLVALVVVAGIGELG